MLMNEENPFAMITMHEAANLSGVGYGTVRRWCLAGNLPHVRAGRKILINAAVFVDFLGGRKNENCSDPDRT